MIGIIGIITIMYGIDRLAIIDRTLADLLCIVLLDRMW
jgi:hypothetical protein